MPGIRLRLRRLPGAPAGRVLLPQAPVRPGLLPGGPGPGHRAPARSRLFTCEFSPAGRKARLVPLLEGGREHGGSERQRKKGTAETGARDHKKIPGRRRGAESPRRPARFSRKSAAYSSPCTAAANCAAASATRCRYKPLGEAVVEMAIAAAFEDPRFPPVTADELGELEIEISVLTVPQKVERLRPGPGRPRRHHHQQGIPARPAAAPGAGRAGLGPGTIYLLRLPQGGAAAQTNGKRGVQIEVFQAIVFGEKEQREGA